MPLTSSQDTTPLSSLRPQMASPSSQQEHEHENLSAFPPIHFILHTIAASILTQFALPLSSLDSHRNVPFTKDGGLDYAAPSQVPLSTKQPTKAQSATIFTKKPPIADHLIFQQARKSALLSMSFITKSKVEEYILSFVQYLEVLATNHTTSRTIKSADDKMKALARWVKDKLPRVEWDLCFRIILEMERYGIFHIRSIATRDLFSLMPSLNLESAQDARERLSTPNHRRIIIIGAGASGIVAAIRLKQMGYQPLILEARQRVGGRVHSCDHADMGATIMTGGENNPVYHWCKAMRIPMHRISDSGRIFDFSGNLIPLRYEIEVQDVFNKLLDKVTRMTDHELSLLIGRTVYNARNVSLGEALRALCHNYVKTFLHPEERESILKLFYWHIANLEYGIGTDLTPVGLKGWNLDDRYETKGHHFHIKGGVAQVFKKLVQIHKLDIRFEHHVTSVDYSSGDKVRIRCTKESRDNAVVNPRTNAQQSEGHTSPFCAEYVADKVLVTVPLPVLKSERIQFSPPLPQWKTNAIKKMGFGVLNKVILFFEKRFWPEELHYFGQTAKSSAEALCPPKSRRFHSYLYWDMTESVGSPCLMALVPGNAALNIETVAAQEVISEIMNRLTSMFEHTPKAPTKFFITNWKSDELSGGCYAFVARDCFGIPDYDVLAREVGKNLFFAGEHTMGLYSATVLGAVLSGLREAAKIDSSLSETRDDPSFEHSGSENLLSESQKLQTLMNL